MSASRKTLTCLDYTVGWISALPLEIAAARAMLDDVHSPLPVRENDSNVYYLGEIAGHNIVLTFLPSGVYGNTSATAAAIQMKSAFPCIKYGLMVGIGGGAPSTLNDIRLGDVVVSKPTAQFGGVVQYDFGKTLADGVFHQTGVLNKPPEALLKAVAQLQANHIMGKKSMPLHLKMAAETYPAMHESFIYPRQNQDVLFHESYPHQGPSSSACEGICDVKKSVDRKTRPSALPEIHYGLIASANQVMRDAKTRDRLSEKFGILCFDMEAAGLMDHLPCLVIRGISDYADSHKDRAWQKYAAATAAAYAKELLYTSIPGTTPGEQAPASIKVKIPIPKAKVFGRQHELQMIKECFSIPEKPTKPAVLWGLSGCGKTQLALNYVDTEKDHYDSVLWVNSSSISVITDSFEQIARLIPSGFSPEKIAVERVLEWLEQDSNRSWMIIYDNIPYVGDTGRNWHGAFDIRKYLPSCKHGHAVLVTTSCHLHSRLNFSGIHVQGLDEDAGAEVILQYANIESPDESTTATAGSISRKLGGLPLALEQAGSFLSYGLVSIKDYSRRFETGFRNETLKAHTRAYIGSYEKEQTLWTVFDMLHETLGQRNSDSLKLLHLAVFLGTGYVPFRLLVSGKSSTYPAGTSDNANSDIISWLEDISNDFSRLPSALGEIENTGLVKFMRNRSDNIVDTIVIHDLVQSFIRAKMTKQDILENAAASIFLSAKTYLSNGIMEDDEAMRSHSHRLSTVLNTFLSTVPRDLIQPPHGEYFMLFGSVAPLYARACRLKGELQKARDAWEICLQYRLVTEGSRWPRTEVQLNELLEAADVDLRLGHLDSALEKYASVVRHCPVVRSDQDDIMIRASASLRDAREIHARRESDFQRAIATQRATKSASEEPNQASDIGDEEWEMIMRYEETFNLFGPMDRETFQHGSALAAYYKEHDLPTKEETYREIIWKYHVASAGSSNPVTVASLFELCLCYGKNGKLREKLRGDLYDAPVYAGYHESSEFSRLLLEMETLDILAAFKIDDKDTAWNLLNRHDTMTAIFWASAVGSIELRDTLLYHFTKTDFPAVCLFLHLKAVYGQGSAFKVPCKSDIDICQSDIDFSRGLQQAAKWGYVSVVQGFLENNIDTSFADSSGKAALHLAAERGDIFTVLMLLEHGVDTSQADCYGRTALHYAVKGRDTELLKTLVESCGKAINEQDNHGETALHYASMGQDSSKVYLLVNHGANVTLKDNNGDTPLHYATRGRRMESVKVLLEFGSDPTQANNDGQTLLHCGLHAGLDLFKLLLKHAGDVSQTDSRGRAVIHYAAELGHTDIVKAILDRAANIDTTDNRGNTALHLAAGRGNHAVTQLLLNADADRFVENNFENTALELAFQGGHEKTVDLILSQSLKKRDPYGQTFLHRAARKPEDMSFFYAVIGPSNDIINATDNHGRTALHVAAASGNLFAVQMLLDNGANHQIESYGGESPLEDALMQRTEAGGTSKGDIALEEVIRLLRKAGSGPENAERRSFSYKGTYNDKASLEKGTWHGYSVDPSLI